MTAPDGGPDNPAHDPLIDLAVELHDLIDVQTSMGRQITALVREIDEIVRDPDPDDPEDAGGRLARLRAQLDVLADGLEKLAGRENQIRVPCWVDMSGPEAEKTWLELVRWIETVLFARYGAQTSWIPCWYRHPELVEELTWLWKAWESAYRHPKASPGLAGEWHLRWWPHVRDKINQAGRGCNAHSGHKDPYGVDTRPVDSGFEAHVAADIAARPAPEESS